MLHVKQPDIIMSGVWLETKPLSVHVLTVHLHNVQKKNDVLEKPTSACRPISWKLFYQYYMIYVCETYKRILMLENSNIQK